MPRPYFDQRKYLTYKKKRPFDVQNERQIERKIEKAKNREMKDIESERKRQRRIEKEKDSVYRQSG